MNKAPASRFIKTARWFFSVLIVLLIALGLWILNLASTDTTPDAGLVYGLYIIAIPFVLIIVGFLWGFLELGERAKRKQANQPKTASPQAKRKATIAGWLIVLLGVLTLLIIWLGIRSGNGIKVNSFASCVAAGNAVALSYPEQCTANGQTFTNPDHLQQ